MGPKKDQGAKALRRRFAEELGRELQVAEDRCTEVILKRVEGHGAGNEDRYELERTGAQTLERNQSIEMQTTHHVVHHRRSLVVVDEGPRVG
jgi:hypothetical protein